jgi:methylthioribose-1-phosphate isomerase
MAKQLSDLVACGREFYERRWMWGTSGNLSVKLRSDPLEIAITPSGVNKGHLSEEDLLILKDNATPKKHPRGRVPSSEMIIHQTIYRALPGCGAVFHVHPIYATLISSFHGHPKERRTLRVDWMETIYGLGGGVGESAEVMILPSWPDVSLIARDVKDYLEKSPKALPVVLLYNHGLTAWGRTCAEARNNLEIMEYVCQYLYLKRLVK